MRKSSNIWKRGRLPAFTLAAALGATPSLAQSMPESTDNQTIWQREELLGDLGGVRPALAAHGVTIGVNDSENLLGNMSGGVKNGATMQGVTTGTLEIDTGKAFGLPGGLFHVTGLQLHGQPLSGPYLDNLQAANGNEGEDGTRLWELWYDQKFAGGLFDIKIGQQSIDNEFMLSQNSALFVNTMAGLPLVPSDDLYDGGPAYPLSSLGARVQYKPGTNQDILLGVFDDNPGGGAFGDDAQQLDRNGGRFNLNTGALWIAEYQYSAAPFGLSGTYKIGGWYDSGSFPDQAYGEAKMHQGNYSLYAVVDQTVWQSSSNNARNVNLFGRVMGAPDAQNYISFFFNGGVTVAAPLPGRNGDMAGLDFGIGKVSSRAAARDAASGLPRQKTEELFELTYQAKIFPWLNVQPDVQYVVNPGGGVLNPNDPAHNLRNELVAGMRVSTTF